MQFRRSCATGREMTGTDAGVGVCGGAREAPTFSATAATDLTFCWPVNARGAANALARFSRFVTGQISTGSWKSTHATRGYGQSHTSSSDFGTALLEPRDLLRTAPRTRESWHLRPRILVSKHETRARERKPLPSERASRGELRASTMGVDDGSNPLAPEFANPLPAVQAQGRRR